MSHWRRGLQQAWDQQPAVILLAVLCLIGNAVALTAVLIIILAH